MGLDFLFSYFNTYFSKVLLLLIGVWLVDLFFPSFLTPLYQILSYAIGTASTRVFSHEAALFLSDFLVVVMSSHFFRWIFFIK